MQIPLAVMFAAAAVSIGGQTEPLDDAWLAELQPMGWEFAGIAEDAVLYVRAPSTAGNYRRIWARYEFETMQAGGYVSYGELNQVDCAGGRYQVLQGMGYPRHNLQGPSVSSGPGSGVWSYAMPGTLGEDIINKACANGE